MTHLSIEIVDLQHNNQIEEINQLTRTGLEMLITDCERKLEQLKDAFYEIDKNE